MVAKNSRQKFKWERKELLLQALSKILKDFQFSKFVSDFLMEIVEYSQVKVIPKDLISTFFDKDFKCF